MQRVTRTDAAGGAKNNLSESRTIEAERTAELDRAARAVLDGGAKLAGFDRAIISVRMCSLRGGHEYMYTRLDDRDLASQYLTARAEQDRRNGIKPAAGAIAEPDDERAALEKYKREAANAWRTPEDK
jgi:hypothetical protein